MYETTKLLKAGFIKEIHFTIWLANVVIGPQILGEMEDVSGPHGFEQGMPKRCLSTAKY